MAVPHPHAGALPLPEQGATATRIAAVDLFRGLAIVAVVLHHVTGMALPRTGAPGEVLAILNRALLFVVPAFLFITALVLTRSALKGFRFGRYYRARAQTALLPYVLWTVLYVLFRVLTKQDDVAALADPERWRVWLQYGKGYFHLYYLLIVLQFYLVLPALLPLWRRSSPFLAVLVGSFALQLLVFVLNRQVLHFRFPGTMALWHLPSICLGMYFGANYAQFGAFWRRWRAYVVGAAVLTLLWYVPLGVRVLGGAPVNTLVYSAANWAYTSASVLALFGLAHTLAGAPAWLRRVMASLGGVSLQVYLLHPAVLALLGRWEFPADSLFLALALLGDFALALGLPWLLARALSGSPASRWLFGR